MPDANVEFIVLDGWDENSKSSKGIQLDLMPVRSATNLDYKIHLPLKLRYQKHKSDSFLRISAKAKGDKGLATYRSFRGQFISCVNDEKTNQDIHRIEHLVHRGSRVKKTYVERCTWEEGLTPSIQFITQEKNGEIDLDFIGILGADDVEYNDIDTRIGIEISVDECVLTSNRRKNLGSFQIEFSKSEKDSDYCYEDDEFILRHYHDLTHKTTGVGHSIHPKQLLTVEALGAILKGGFIDQCGGQIDLGYIGLDTGENILSVLRFIHRANLIPKISSLNIIITPEWDDENRKKLEQRILESGLTPTWYEADEKDTLDNCRVDLMISTYVAVWAANMGKIETAEHQKFFENAYTCCKEDSILISVDPHNPKKIARSHRNTGTIDVTGYYRVAGFSQIKENLVQGTNATCKATFWKRGDRKYRSGLMEETNKFVDYITTNAKMIRCAGIPTDATKLALADVLEQHNSWHEDDPNFLLDVIGSIEPKVNGVREFILMSKNEKIDPSRPEKILLGGIRERVITESWNDAHSLVKSILSLDLPEIPLLLFSRKPVVINGKPGDGKSVRLTQIAAFITQHESINSLPLYVKAKHLAAMVTFDADFIPSDIAEELASAFLASHPNAKNYNLNLNDVSEHLLELLNNAKDSDENCKLVLIVDAFDEINQRASAGFLLDWLEQFSDTYCNGYSNVLISTRPSHLEMISEHYEDYSRFDIHFADEILQEEFPKKLVEAWNVTESVAENTIQQVKDDSIFPHVNNPLLMGWVCKFIKERKTDFFQNGNIHKIHSHILDIAFSDGRREHLNSLSQKGIESAKRLRDFIALMDIFGLSEIGPLIDFSSYEDRLQFLQIRDTELFSELGSISDEEAHRIFFEDLGLLYVSGSGNLEWTHEHLREKSASLNFTSGDRDSMIEWVLRRFNLEHTPRDIISMIETQIIPHRPFFRDACRANAITDGKSIRKDTSQSISPPQNPTEAEEKLTRLYYLVTSSLSESVHPTEFTDLLSDEIGTFRGMMANVTDIQVNPTNKKHFIEIINYFMNKSISWLVPAFERDFSGERADTYLELITGGIIPKLSQKLLTVDERKKLFLPYSIGMMKSYEEPGYELDEEYLKLLIYFHFVASCDKANFANFHILLAKNFLPTHETLDANGLLVRRRMEDIPFRHPKSGRFSDLFQKFIQPMNHIPLNHRPDINLRGDIRRVIFTKVRDNSVDIVQDVIGINRILRDFSKRYKDFEQLEKLNIEITVPIRLPPNGKKGDCKVVVEEVKKSLNELGGGTTTYNGAGSWLDDENKVVSDDCVVVYTAMPINKWFECIPILKRLIRDEIQTKLFQKCVFIRIDNQTFGEPLNLLGDQIEAFPSIEEFGNIDSACMTMMSEHKEHPIQSVMIQKINGDGNTQIGGGNNAIAIGEGVVAAKGNVTIINNVMDPIIQALYEEKIANLEQKLTKLDQETDEERQHAIALEASALAEEMRKNQNIEFDAWVLVELGNTAELAGQLERAEGYYKQAKRKFLTDDDRKGEAASLGNLGNIAYTRGDLAEAERLQRESLAVEREIGNRQGEAASLNNLGLIAETRGDLAEAERLQRESLKIRREIGDRQGEAASLGSLGNIANTRGDLAEAERLYRESLAIKREIGDRQGEAASLNNLGEIQSMRGYMDQADQLFTECMELSGEIGYRTGMMASLANKGNLLIIRKQEEKSVELLNQALLISREIGDRRQEAQILSHLGRAAFSTRNIRLARVHFNKSLDIQREMNDTIGVGRTLRYLGNVAVQMGNLREATSLVRESISISKKFGIREEEGASYVSLGEIYAVQGKISEAMASYTTARDILSELENQLAVAEVMVSLGVNHAYLWELDEAERMFNASLSIYNTIGNKNSEQNIRDYLEKLLIQKKSREEMESEDIGLGSQIGLRIDGESVFGTIVELDDEKSTVIIKKDGSRDLISGLKEDMFKA